MPTIILTGYDKWDNKKYNSSWEMLESAEFGLPTLWKVELQKLPVSWEHAPNLLQQTITEDVRAIVCLGMGGGNKIRCERVALNLIDPSLRDVDGKMRDSEFVNPDGPPAYWTRLPFRRICAALQEQAIPCVESHYAGAYLCNYIFYWLLHYLNENRLDIVAGFIHAPPFEDQGGLEKVWLSQAANVIANVVVDFVDRRRMELASSTKLLTNP